MVSGSGNKKRRDTPFSGERYSLRFQAWRFRNQAGLLFILPLGVAHAQQETPDWWVE